MTKEHDKSPFTLPFLCRQHLTHGRNGWLRSLYHTYWYDRAVFNWVSKVIRFGFALLSSLTGA